MAVQMMLKIYGLKPMMEHLTRIRRIYWRTLYIEKYVQVK